ncbi:MAG: hypothetical protein OEQ29_02295 [Alphaproteobacteria bacterium]|nr:hypothetical protein [Alphaproteobacteria bacterium]
MGQTVTLFFGGSWIGIAIAVGLLIFFYKFTRSKWVVGIVAVFLIATRFTWISVEDRPNDGPIQEIGANERK